MRAAPLVLALWTLLVWGVRIKNADGSWAAIILSLTFVALALLVLVTRGHALPTVMLGGWTVLVWAVRLVQIVFFSDRGAGFKLVHVAIGVISILLAGWNDEALDGAAARPDPPSLRA